MINYEYLEKNLTFGFEQTLTIPSWWTDEGFTATSDTPLKREKMLLLAKEISSLLKGSFKESLDIWDHMQYETFDQQGKPSFVVTMDPGSIEVKTQPTTLKNIKPMIETLFKASENCDLVPYRNWWYGIKGGTEGGCHINMGGFEPETNPLKLFPDLVVKYAAYIHNRPFLHYPFMSLDVGPEGNAMRMDEKPNFDKVQKAFKTFQNNLNPTEVYEHFKDTNLINDKASFPSLFKFKPPLFLIEDRGQEAMRTADEFFNMCYLRLKILSEIALEPLEELKVFDSSLHQEDLTSYKLWANFQNWANERNINPVNYQCFFDRQFPVLWMGENKPSLFGLKEGKRPRVIKDIKKRGDTIISKTIDTSFKRFEVFCYSNIEPSIHIKSEKVDAQSQLIKHDAPLGLNGFEQAYYLYCDIQVLNDPILEIQIQLNDQTEIGRFNLKDMMWV